MACLKFLLKCPCPRCLLLKSKIPLLRSKTDWRTRISQPHVDNEDRRNMVEAARGQLFDKGKSLVSLKVEGRLVAHSLVPTRVCTRLWIISHLIINTRPKNAFSERLFEHGFNFYTMFVPDLLHEFELGVWKAVFTHLIRILYAYGHDAIQTLNKW